MKTQISKYKAIAVLSLLGWGLNVFGMAAKPPADNGTGSCPLPSQKAKPRRKVVINPVTTLPFKLPNGKDANLAVKLGDILGAQVSMNPAFMKQDPQLAAQDPCQAHLEIRAAVSSMEFRIGQGGVRFGYTLTQGDIGNGTGTISGAVTVTGGEIGMTFELAQCLHGTCSSPVSALLTNATVGAEVNFEFTMDPLSVGADLEFNTAFTDIINNMMKKGVETLQASPFLAQTWWNASVLSVDPVKHKVIFDAGSFDGLVSGNVFSILSAIPGQGACGAFEEIGRVHAVSVGPNATQSVIDLSTGDIKVGDIVRVVP